MDNGDAFALTGCHMIWYMLQMGADSLLEAVQYDKRQTD